MDADELSVLKPCPFCGGHETQVREDSKHWTGMRWTILSWLVIHWCNDTPGSTLQIRGKTREQAIGRWNSRE